MRSMATNRCQHVCGEGRVGAKSVAAVASTRFGACWARSTLGSEHVGFGACWARRSVRCASGGHMLGVSAAALERVATGTETELFKGLAGY